MNSGTSTLDAAAVLATARRARAEANAAETQVLVAAVEWARLHEVTDLDDAATWWAGRGVDTGIPIAGEGAPMIAEFSVAEFATALGMTAESGRNLLAQAIELAHRLPRVWARVRSAQLAPWRARRIAEQTLCLSPDAASFVDAQVAPFAHKIGPAQTERLVEEAIARFMPQFAAERRDRTADQRHFSIDHQQVSFAGTSRVDGELNLADALDLDAAITAGAAQLAALGNEESLDVRRSLAAGMLARGQEALDLETGEVVSTRSLRDRTSTTDGREVVLYVHLSEDALRTNDPDAPARLTNAGGRLITAGQVAEWCRAAGQVTVKPVIDLAEHIRVDAYEVPDRLAEQVELRDVTCVFPWCTRHARGCDKDHVIPYADGGPTSSDNLAALCRRHHRLKTHGDWNYTMLEPGSYLWRSPHGYTYLRAPT